MSSQLEILSGSIEYVRTEIVASKEGVSYNPTADQVDFAFVAVGDDVDTASWTTGSWETAPVRFSRVRPSTYARCLVGADVGLLEGTYGVYVKVSDAPEIPRKYVGQLIVT